jgi:hypothetical protein
MSPSEASCCGASSILEHSQTDSYKQLGKVNFETTCAPAAQKLFNQGMLYQHSFWYRASNRSFEEALKADPQCAMAHWGIALSLLYNPHAPPPPANLALGLAAIQKAKALNAKTERERDYIDALGAMYVDYDKLDHRTRVQNYLKAQERVAQKYPKDIEAQIAYAITLNVAALPTDKTYANQLKGAALLEPIYKLQPQHPGVAHYLIHLYDYPAIAQKGLNAAKRYAKIAPAAPHAQHMPSHIFTRVGYWKDSIAANAESARVAKLDGEQHDQVHGMDYLVYAHLQLAQDKKAAAIVDEMNAIDFKIERFAGPYGVAASNARYAVERGDWPAAVHTPATSNQIPLRRCGHAFRARARRGTLRQYRRCESGRRKARRTQRQAQGGEGCLLVRNCCRPAAGCDRLGASR